MNDEIYWHKAGRILYTNWAIRADFRYGDGTATHLFWRFWWLNEEVKT